jgi:hypothetical protein
MNPRVKELAEQAGGVVLAGSEIQKFAQLIVRECMNVLDPGEHQLIARFHARQWLAEHFGVEQ